MQLYKMSRFLLLAVVHCYQGGVVIARSLLAGCLYFKITILQVYSEVYNLFDR